MIKGRTSPGDGRIKYPTSDWLNPRLSPADKKAGKKERDSGWRHAGVDITCLTVYAPEDGIVVQSRNKCVKGTGFGNYGPGCLVIKGNSGKYHWLAHLKTPLQIHASAKVKAGNSVGRTARGIKHVHWEVRRYLFPGKDETGKQKFPWQITVDPIRWLKGNDLDAQSAVEIMGVGQKLRGEGSYPMKMGTLKRKKEKSIELPEMTLRLPTTEKPKQKIPPIRQVLYPEKTRPAGVGALALMLGGLLFLTLMSTKK